MFITPAARSLALLLAFTFSALAENRVPDAGTAVQAKAPQPAGAYVVQLRDGRELKVTQPPRWSLDMADVTTVDGKAMRLYWTQVDHAATKRSNAKPVRKNAFTNDDLARYGGQRLSYAPPPPPRVAGGTRSRSSSGARGTSGTITDAGTLRKRERELVAEIARVESELAAVSTVGGSERSEAPRVGGDVRTTDEPVVNFTKKDTGSSPRVWKRVTHRRSATNPDGTPRYSKREAKRIWRAAEVRSGRSAQKSRRRLQLTQTLNSLRSELDRVRAQLRSIRQGTSR